MRKAAGYSKLLLFILFSFFGSLAFLILDLSVRLLRKNPVSLQNRFMRTWAQGTAFLFNIHVKSHGKAPVPPFMLVSNHLSYLDIVPLYLHLRCTFVAKKEVRNWPLLGYMVSKMGVIFVDRGRKADVIRVNRQIRNAVSERQGLVLFPEGTSSAGKTVLPFKAPLLETAARESIPVYSASIRYRTSPSDPPAEETVCFFGARHSFFRHVTLMAQNRRIDCAIAFHEESLQHNDRKELTEKLHRRTLTLFDSLEEEMGIRDANEGLPAEERPETAPPV